MTTVRSTATVATILHNAQVFNPQKWKATVNPPNLNQVLQTLDALFAELEDQHLPYLLVGGIAMLSYVEGRNTEDIDLIMARSDLSQLTQLVVTEENRDFAQATYQGLRVDLLLSQNPLFEKVQQDYQTEVIWANRSISCATPEGLVILKLYALPSLFRQGQFDRAALYETDILQLAYRYDLNLSTALQEVYPYIIASDRSELRQITDDINQRRQRMVRSSQQIPGLDIEPER